MTEGKQEGTKPLKHGKKVLQSWKKTLKKAEEK